MGEHKMSRVEKLVERLLSERLSARDMIDNAEMIDVVNKGGQTNVYIQWRDNSDTALFIKGNRVTDISSASFGGYASEFERLFKDTDIQYLLTSAKYK